MTKDKFQELQALDQVKRDFLQIISHELRTPLTTILAYSESLIKNNFSNSELQKNFAFQIHGAALYLHQLIDDALLLAAIGAGKIHLQQQFCDLEMILRDATSHVQGLAQEKKVAIESNVAIGNREIVGDRGKLTTAIARILSHALRECEENTTLIITCGLHQRSKKKESEKSTILVTVGGSTGYKNRKQPIKKAQPPELFKSLNGTAEGLHYRSGQGLGLALARHLLELHAVTLLIAKEGERWIYYVAFSLPG